jgi:hypothetical protein
VKVTIIFFSLLLLINSCGDQTNSIVARNVTIEPVIDAVKEKVWDDSEETLISDMYSGEPYYEGEKDISGKFHVLHDSIYIYFFFEVTDNVKYTHAIPVNEFDGNNWHPEDYDNVSILFDLNNDKIIDYKKTGDDCILVFNYNVDRSFGNIKPNADSIRFKQSNTPIGYNFEIKIPLKVLNIEPTKNKEIGFCIRMSDNDRRLITPEAMDVLGGRESEIVWPKTSYYKDYYKSIGFLKFE